MTTPRRGMNLLQRIGRNRSLLALAVAVVITTAVIQGFSDDPEIALKIGEPWEDMRQRSSAAIEPAIPGHFWGTSPDAVARLRFLDPRYGFVTPLARSFTVSFESDETVGSVRLSPQVEPLSLDDTLKTVLDLQEQWREAGWTPIWVSDFPSFAATAQWRTRLRDASLGGTAYWRAGQKYQLMLVVHRFKDSKRPTEERYLITLQLATPWGRP